MNATSRVPDDLSSLGDPNRIRVVIITTGAGHHEPIPEDALTINLADKLRNPPADPQVRDRLTNLTGLDKPVRDYVLSTPGARQKVDQVYAQTHALLGWAAPQRRLVIVHLQCWGGRHRSVALAEEIAAWLRADGIGVETEHRHIHRPVLPCRPRPENG